MGANTPAVVASVSQSTTLPSVSSCVAPESSQPACTGHLGEHARHQGRTSGLPGSIDRSTHRRLIAIGAGSDDLESTLPMYPRAELVSHQTRVATNSTDVVSSNHPSHPTTAPDFCGTGSQAPLEQPDQPSTGFVLSLAQLVRIRIVLRRDLLDRLVPAQRYRRRPRLESSRGVPSLHYVHFIHPRQTPP